MARQKTLLTFHCSKCGHENTVDERPTKKQAACNVDEAFANFWASYPKLRRQKKGKAEAAYKRAVERMMHNDDMSRADAVAKIQEAVAEFAMSALGKGPYCPGPEPWLNADRWDDDREGWGFATADDVPRAKPDKPLPKAADLMRGQ